MCQKFFKVEKVDTIMAIDQQMVCRLIDQANESEFMIAHVHRTTVEVVKNLLDGCTPMD